MSRGAKKTRSVVPPRLSAPETGEAGWADLFASLDESADPKTALTRAESIVVVLVRSGLTNREIAAQLGQSEATVKRHVSACLKKFLVPTRTRLIALLR